MSVTNERLAELTALHVKQRDIHARRCEIKAACLVDDILAAFSELQQRRETDKGECICPTCGLRHGRHKLHEGGF